MKLSIKLLLTLPLLWGVGAAAQESGWSPPSEDAPPEISDAAPLRDVNERRGPSWEPGNAEAREYARSTGLSLGQATSELRRMNALNRFVERLQDRRPELFSFVSMRSGRLVIGLTDPSADLTDILPRGLLDPDFVTAALSAEEAERITQATSMQLAEAGFEKVSVGLAPENGQLTFLAGDQVSELQAAIDSGQVDVDLPYEIQDGEIVVSGTLYGSAAYETDPSRCSSLCGGTTGFSVMSTESDATRYVTTAGHISNARARFNRNADASYASGGYVSLGSTIDLLSNGLDIQLASPTDSTNNPPGPYIWDGTQYVTIRGAIYPIGGILMCKFGRFTGPGCGLTEDPVRTWNNSAYGLTNIYMIEKPSSTSTYNWNREGDSGGPVWRGDWAAGWIHGRHKTDGHLFYTSTRDFRQSGLPYDLIVAP